MAQRFLYRMDYLICDLLCEHLVAYVPENVRVFYYSAIKLPLKEQKECQVITDTGNSSEENNVSNKGPSYSDEMWFACF